MIKELEEYLERRGAKYFVTLLMICYILGTLIFTIYLGSLGVSDFEFLQLRYIFAGIIFMLLTALLFLPLFLIFRYIFKQKSERFYEVIFTICLLFWTPLYAINIFPLIPSNFGGAKPVIARFIGETSRIKEINKIIENETGATDLPLEIFIDNLNLAKGANVKILDRNKDRIWLILTKDLYLSSKSNLAKVLMEAGESLEDIKGVPFVSKPLFVETSGIKSISFTLYEPPEILTEEDLNILKSTPSLSAKSTEVVHDFIVEKLPKKASEIIKALEEKNETNISEVIESSFDSSFLSFREEFFQKGIHLFDKERSTGIVEIKRWEFVFDMLQQLHVSFSDEDILLEDYPYLTIGISEEKYSQKIARALQGVPDLETFLKRLKLLTVDIVKNNEPKVDVNHETNVEEEQEDVLDEKEEDDRLEATDDLLTPLETGSGLVIE